MVATEQILAEDIENPIFLCTRCNLYRIISAYTADEFEWKATPTCKESLKLLIGPMKDQDKPWYCSTCGELRWFISVSKIHGSFSFELTNVL